MLTLVIAAQEIKIDEILSKHNASIGDTKKQSELKNIITLLSTSKVHYMDSSSNGTHEYDWDFNVIDVKFNQQLKDGFFNF